MNENNAMKTSLIAALIGAFIVIGGISIYGSMP
jgi:hypothetical protein